MNVIKKENVIKKGKDIRKLGVIKKIKLVLLLLILIIAYCYSLIIGYLPDQIILFEGEKLDIPSFFGINFSMEDEDGVIETSSNISESISEDIGVSKMNVNLFNQLSIKDIDVSILPKTTVIPVGNLAGVKLYTNGVLVVGMSEIQGEDNKMYKPYEKTGIEEGDTIIAVNNQTIHSTEDLISCVNKSLGNEVEIDFVRDNEALQCSMTPVKTQGEEYKLGLWVRDSAAGVGTVTFYEPESKTFAALGHGIVDIDTKQLINISSGEFVTTKILNIQKGEKGEPGRIQGTIDNQPNIGTIYKNTKFGIYGKVDNLLPLNLNNSKEMEVALRDEIHTGKATILATLEKGKTQEYDIEIKKIFKENNYDNKSMQIKIVDEDLLEKTGGIIQGMSGSPIIQDGKFIGAVTHVLVNNPQEGYAVFGDIMIKQLKSIE